MQDLCLNGRHVPQLDDSHSAEFSHHAQNHDE